MRICIDSNVFIFGVARVDAHAETLMRLLPQFDIAVPRLVILEVTRNLDKIGLTKRFFAAIRRADQFCIVDESVPTELVTKYVSLGLPAKADAIIGAFAEWTEARYLISDNRHFLRDLSTIAYEVLSAEEFLNRWRVGEL